MKRFHIHVAVENVEDSILFYNNLFGSAPTETKTDYAKWMLDDPRVNFAISARGREPGLDHLGIQAENEGELKDLSKRLKASNIPVLDEGATICCYATSEKAWVVDPQGIAWETFLTTGQTTIYGLDNEVTTDIPMSKNSACCAPSVEAVQVQIKGKSTQPAIP